MVGRKKIEITSDVIQEVQRLAGRGLTEAQITASLGWASSTFYKRKKDVVEFSDAIKRGKAMAIAEVANALFEKAMAGNVTAMIFYLKNRDKENWCDRPETRFIDEPLPFEVIIQS